jgi:hypothetical protein
MSTSKNLQEFFDENIRIIKEYIETRSSIYKLKAVRSLSGILGLLMWFVISAFLGFLVLIFIGLVLGFWFSEMTGSMASGFGIATLLLLVVIVLIALLRRQLFIYPLIRIFIHVMTSQDDSAIKNDEYDKA